MVWNLFRLRGSISNFYRCFSTGKAVMEAGKRAAARCAVDEYVKVSLLKCIVCDLNVM